MAGRPDYAAYFGNGPAFPEFNAGGDRKHQRAAKNHEETVSQIVFDWIGRKGEQLLVMEKGWLKRDGCSPYESVMQADFLEYAYFINLYLISSGKT